MDIIVTPRGKEGVLVPASDSSMKASSGWCSPLSMPQCRICSLWARMCSFSQNSLIVLKLISEEEREAWRGYSQDNRTLKTKNQHLTPGCWWRSWRTGHTAMDTHLVCSNWPPQPWWQELVHLCQPPSFLKVLRPHTSLFQRKTNSLDLFLLPLLQVLTGCVKEHFLFLFFFLSFVL